MSPSAPAAASHDPDRPRLLFYSADVTGLGNIRRTMAIVEEVARLRPASRLLCLTGSFQTHAFDLPPNFDYVKLPSVRREDVYRGLPRSSTLFLPTLGGVWATRERVIEATALAFEPRLVLVDHAPAGIFGEARQALLRLRERWPRVEIVYGLRDVVDEPAALRKTWQEHGVYELLDQVYDQILVYGDRRVLDPIVEYDFPPALAARTTFCGYVLRDEPLAPVDLVRARFGATERPLVAVTAGGGEDSASLLRRYLDALETGALAGVVSALVAGPLMAEATWAALVERAASLPDVHLERFTAEPLSVVNAADLLVTGGGLSAIEAVGLGTRVLALPPTGKRDQEVRATRFARLGLVQHLPRAEAESDRLARAVAEALTTSPPPLSLDFGGRRRAAEALIGRLETSPFPDASAAPPNADVRPRRRPR